MSSGAVTPAEALDDAAWFADNPRRRYRLRPGWIVRRRGNATFLRAPLIGGASFADAEACAERVWWLSAWPELDAKTRDALARAARPPRRKSGARQ